MIASFEEGVESQNFEFLMEKMILSVEEVRKVFKSRFSQNLGESSNLVKDFFLIGKLLDKCYIYSTDIEFS